MERFSKTQDPAKAVKLSDRFNPKPVPTKSGGESQPPHNA